MEFSNLKSDSDRLSSNANGDPWFKKADPKTQISPRFALAFPITDKGYLHFSYGHFFRIQVLVTSMITQSLKCLSIWGQFDNGQCQYGTTANDTI